MNKDKLIGLIVKKQSYKDTKQVQNDILKKKEQAVSVSIAAIYHILKQQYNAEAKLYAIRYLRDCFEKGNTSFIHKVEQRILPLMETIIKDSNDQNKIVKYAGSSYSKNSDLQTFKTLVSSLFVMCRQCIENWGSWITDPEQQFFKLKKSLQKDVPFNHRERFQYFRKQNELIFRQNCKKNGFQLQELLKSKVQQNESEISPFQKSIIGGKQFQNSKQKNSLKVPHNKLSQILQQIEKKVDLSIQMPDNEMKALEKKFNRVVNQYIEEERNFDEAFFESSLSKFQQLKTKEKEKKKVVKSKIVKKIKQQQIQPVQLNIDKNQIQQNQQKQQIFEDDIIIDTKQKLQKGKNRLQKEQLKEQLEDQERVNFDQSSQNQDQITIKSKNTHLKQSKTHQIPQVMHEKQFPQQLSLLRQQKQELIQRVKLMDRQITILKQTQKKMLNQIKNSINYKEYEKLKKQLLIEKKQKHLLCQEIQQLKNELKRLEIKNLQQAEKKENSHQQSQSYKIKKVKAEQVQVKNSSQPSEGGSKLKETDHQYRMNFEDINCFINLTNLQSWISNNNILRLKKTILKIDQIFFENQLLTISKAQNLFSKQDNQYCKLTLSFLFKEKQTDKPKTSYKNIQQIDLWTKPISNPKLQIYTQEMISRLCNNPLKLIRGTIGIVSNINISFVLPLIFFNFLRMREFQDDQFEQIFENKKSNIVKSNVLKINNQIACNSKDLVNIFNTSNLRKHFVQFCLIQQCHQNVYMVQLQTLKNQKAILRILPIPYNPGMIIKAKQLIHNLIFLLSQ